MMSVKGIWDGHTKGEHEQRKVEMFVFQLVISELDYYQTTEYKDTVSCVELLSTK
jgi:hypothetical protein